MQELTPICGQFLVTCGTYHFTPALHVAEVALEFDGHNDSLLLQVDMSKEEHVKEMVDYTMRMFDRLDIFVNNAARFVFAHATEVTDEGQPSVAPLGHHTVKTCFEVASWVCRRLSRCEA